MHFGKTILGTITLLLLVLTTNAQVFRWDEAVIYQIYPRSFQDSDGDGIGDIKGITSRLDYLKGLGVDIIWLSPVYKSPMKDMGYDVSDYEAIDPVFGSMEDFEVLLKETHLRQMKLILDFVPNHTSDEHPWFKEARKSSDNPYHDYYLWRKDNTIPDNRISYFGGSAWEKNALTGEYYFHLFLKEQPDLNWDNPKVREEIYKALTFWLDKGVNGFRLDVIPLISKSPDYPANLRFKVTENAAYTRSLMPGPHLHEYLREMNERVFSRYDCFVLGEGIGINPQSVCDYVTPERKELNLIYHFEVTDLGRNALYIPSKVSPLALKRTLSRWDSVTAGCNARSAVLFGNHDQPRMLNRFGNPRKYRTLSAQMLAMLTLTYRGVPFIYQGDELGMRNIRLKYRELEDVSAINLVKIAGKYGIPRGLAMHFVNKAGRDNARTPVQWNPHKNAGFTEGEPWLKVHPDYPLINAEAQQNDTSSVLHFYKKLLILRRKYPCLRNGNLAETDKNHPRLLIYTRSNSDCNFLIICNLTSRKVKYSLPEIARNGKMILGNYPDVPDASRILPFECRIYECKK